MSDIPYGATHQGLHSGFYYRKSIVSPKTLCWRGLGWSYTDYTEEELSDEKVFTKLEEKQVSNKQFTKADLRTGMVVTFENGRAAMVLLNYTLCDGSIKSILRIGDINGDWMSLDSYSEDLSCEVSKRYTIVKVEQPTSVSAYKYKTVYPVAVIETQQQKDYKEALVKLEEVKALVETLRPKGV